MLNPNAKQQIIRDNSIDDAVDIAYALGGLNGMLYTAIATTVLVVGFVSADYLYGVYNRRKHKRLSKKKS